MYFSHLMRATRPILLIFFIYSKEPLTKNTRHYALNCVIFSSVLGPDIFHNILSSDTPNKRFFLAVKIRTHFVNKVYPEIVPFIR
jgi:hypothetical protein